MTNKTPEEVLRSISADFKIRGITHAEAAEKLDIANKQTLSNLLSSKKYIPSKRALVFHKVFGYNIEYLTGGVGELYPKTSMYGTTEIGGIEYYNQGMAYSKKKDAFVVIDDSQTGDIELMLDWVREYFSRKGDKDGLTLWSEIQRFSKSANLVVSNLRNYRGNNYPQEYQNRLFDLRSEIIENIEQMLDEAKKQ